MAKNCENIRRKIKNLPALHKRNWSSTSGAPPLAIWGLYSDKLEYQGKVDIAVKLLTSLKRQIDFLTSLVSTTSD